MKIKTAGEFMVPLDQYPHINHNATLREAMEILESAQVEHKGMFSTPRMLLVFDDIHQLVGVVRRRDILRGLMPALFRDHKTIYGIPNSQLGIQSDPNLTEMMYEGIIKHMREGVGMKVHEVMRPNIRWVNHDDHLPKAVFYVVSENVSLLPVLKDGHVVGVLRSIDILHEVDRLLMKEEG